MNRMHMRDNTCDDMLVYDNTDELANLGSLFSHLFSTRLNSFRCRSYTHFACGDNPAMERSVLHRD